MTMINTKAIANYFINLAQKNNVADLSPMKLQKLVYYAHGWSLGFYGEPLIDDQIEAWKFGPVIPTIFHAAKKFGNENINTLFADYSYHEEADELTTHIPKIREDDEDTVNLLNFIWDVYGKYSAFTLSNLTHKEGSPWAEVNNRYNGNIPNYTDIDMELIKNSFEEEVAQLMASDDAQ